MLPKLLDPRPYFANLPDPRREIRNKLHPLQDILMIVRSAVLSGIEDWVGMQTFAQEREAWLRRFLALPNGIPSRYLERCHGPPRSGRVPGGVYRLGDGRSAEFGRRTGLCRWKNGPGEPGW